MGGTQLGEGLVQFIGLLGDGGRALGYQSLQLRILGGDELPGFFSFIVLPLLFKQDFLLVARQHQHGNQPSSKNKRAIVGLQQTEAAYIQTEGDGVMQYNGHQAQQHRAGGW